MCGGTPPWTTGWKTFRGLSPRVRGNLRHLPGVGPRGRSIPACAGEPPTATGSGSATPVYPRVCGGTQRAEQRLQRQEGLSPRVRGNRTRTRLERDYERSIPACAGEPPSVFRSPSACRVYPRVCGGTGGVCPCAAGGKGLSPRVRGNPPRHRCAGQCPRSIPACAGEPPMPLPAAPAGAVYPRVCGGTRIANPVWICGAGLSPRVRGNHLSLSPHRSSSGSIPACAGEPFRGNGKLGRGQVYPRVCGGTPSDADASKPGSGLSPRVRGNRGRSAP